MSNLTLLSVECELLQLNELFSVTYYTDICQGKPKAPLSIFNMNSYSLYENFQYVREKLKGLAVFRKDFEL